MIIGPNVIPVAAEDVTVSGVILNTEVVSGVIFVVVSWSI